MSNIISKIITISLYLLMGFSAVLLVVFYFGAVVPGTENTPMREPIVTETLLNWSYILVGLAAVSALLFPLVRMVTNPKNAKKSLLGIVGVAAVVFIAWQFSSDEILPLATENPSNVPQVLKLAGTQLGTMYILLGLAALSIVYTEVRSFFK